MSESASREPKKNASRGSRRPLSDFDVDPWRYRCPNDDCGCHHIIVRKKLGHPKTHTEYEPEAHTYEEPYIHKYRCDRCSNVFDEPFDKKKGEQRHLDVSR